jgi:hypothetical protein
MKYLFHYLKVAFTLARYHDQQEELVWQDLKEYHKVQGYNSGVFEQEKTIESVFSISDTKSLKFTYYTQRGTLHFSSLILGQYDPDIASEVFILATHFNNILTKGCVVVYPDHMCVQFIMKTSYISNIVYPADKHHYTKRHYDSTIDIFWAFNKLIEQGEDPAIIIADLLREKNELNES